MQIDTKNILFLCGGAFVGLENQIAQRLTASSIGFGNPIRWPTPHRSLCLLVLTTSELIAAMYGPSNLVWLMGWWGKSYFKGTS